jgi:glyoxylase-like metal-dependent hydrolase (beta-lactamase superfamily II)/8-oxo-dGTP pyrophosphatase MutT (NUDIX family)
MSKIIDAVSIVITCGDEIFAIQRQHFLKAFPGYWAFPGGKVEAMDENFYITHPVTSEVEPRLFGAAVREGREELGIDLAHEIAEGRIERIDYLGLATTPDFNPYRFATYFFRFHLKEKFDFIIDRNEAHIAEWMSAAELLKQYDSGNILAVPPVIKVIETLGRDPDVKRIDDLNFSYDGNTYVPFIESLKSVRQLMPLSHTLPPANRTNAFLIGEGDARLLIDPSPKDESEYQKLKNTLDLTGFDKILLTHHHPDHHERSTHLAREYKVPMLMSQDTFSRLTKLSPDYFNEIETQFLKEGDVVTQWLGRKVIVYETPGHDEGQICLAADDMSWFLAGDLFQGIGTVVIGDDEGDMKKYFDTLARIIALNPKVVFPSHGIGLGGVAILERVLEHRRVREQQILQYHRDGLTPEQILEAIYKDVDKRLWPFAMKNIVKHFDKLKKENLL